MRESKGAVIRPSALSKQQAPSPVKGILGTAGLLLGTGILFVSIVDAAGTLPASMPPVWVINRPLWTVLALAMMVCGGFLLRKSSAQAWSENGRRPDVRFHKLVLFTRANCHLCEEAKKQLADFSAFLPHVEEVDIDRDPELVARFGDCVPVVEIDGRVRFRGRVNAVLLHRLIEGKSPCADIDEPTFERG